MPGVVVIHWNREEAAGRVAELERAGIAASHIQPTGAVGLRMLRDMGLDAIVIDLGRLPSHGRAVGIELRRNSKTREIPLVFIEGDAEKTARVRELLPDALYTSWAKAAGVIKKAKTSAPAPVAKPETMQSYHGTPLAKKLMINAGSVVRFIDAPDAFERLLNPLPDDVAFVERGVGDVVMLFVTTMTDFERHYAPAVRAMREGGVLWVAWPKRASGAATDVTPQAVREYAMAHGTVDYKICSIDATWSALAFARRRPK